MKKFLTAALSVTLSACLCFGLVACGEESGGNRGEQGDGNEPSCVHTYEEGWSGDDANHWHAATCEHTGLTSGYAPHEWSLTYESTALGHWRKCTVCDRAERIRDHKFGETYLPAEDGHYRVCADCDYKEEKSGHEYEQGVCKTCGFELKETKTLTYTAVEGGYAVAGLASEATDHYIVIPATHEGEDVVAIENNAFKSNKIITYVKIPDSVKTVGDNAFNGCSELAEVSLGKGVQSIGASAFASTVITEIELPDSVTKMGNMAFYYTDLLNVTVPENATELGINLFSWCWQLNTATVKADIAEIPQGMFASCGQLKTVNLHENTLSAGSRAFDGATSFDMDVSRFTTIRSFSFQNSGITNAVIHAELVDTEAFADCKKLTSLTLGDEVTKLNSNAFANCTALKTIQIGKGLKQIGGGANGAGRHSGAFDGCTARETLTVSSENTTFRSENNAILAKSTIKISLVLANAQGDFPSGVKSIGDSAFYGNDKFVDLVIPDTVTYIGECAFGGHDNLKTVRMPSSLTNALQYLFGNCPLLETVTVPTGAKCMGLLMFYNCPNLSRVVFETASNWVVIKNGSTLKTPIDVTDPATNVGYFTEYKEYKWSQEG